MKPTTVNFSLPATTALEPKDVSGEFEAKDSSLKRIPRCDRLENHKKRKDGFCGSNQFLEIPQTTQFIDKRLPVHQDQKVHISPQEGRAQLAVGLPVTFEIDYLEDADKQLDLYYILDLSHTMKDDKDTVASESHRLANELKHKLTKSVRLGFGSFVDKPVMPFASYSQINERQDFVKPYGFRNHLSLTEDITAFQRAVTASKISANTDMAEGGLDAIMQAIVCNNEIGWRENETHKLIVMASDGPFHIAGDGKLGGIVEYNDMVCHLDQAGYYTHSTLQDYPSVGQINHVAKRSKTYIIFAVTEDHFELYSQLSKRIDKSTAGRLRSNSDNVVELVKNQYNNIKGTVELTAAVSKGSSQLLNYIDIQYSSQCGSDGRWVVNSNICKNVGPGKTVKFRVSLKLQKCPPTQRDGEIIFTTFDLTEREQFRVKFNLVCDCNCTKTLLPSDNNKSLLTSICSGHAKRLQCGKCVCDEDHSGSNCECTKSRIGVVQENSGNRTGCTKNGENEIECSGRGQCACGQCDCSQGWGGQFCECDQTKCRLNPNNEYERECANGKGKCDCGQCICNPDRGGDKCQCPKQQTTCVEPGSTTICNGNGDCSCSKGDNSLDASVDWQWSCSLCKPGHFGKYCHVCRGTNCTSRGRSSARCEDPKLISCVQCHVNHHLNGTWTKGVCHTLCEKGGSKDKETMISRGIVRYDATMSSSLSDHETGESTICDVPFNETCSATILYEYESLEQNEIGVKVAIGNMLYCQAPLNFLPYILYAAGGVILIGLMTLLLWKLFTFMLDTREFHKFEKERAAAKWAKGENPLYATPMSTFQNPAYRN
ncbi:integrin beta-PS isoform X2 [Folsomia candida]|uniref:integrin beta-PS isoform X2 n=1 Tax=Folsomia candida TaxID=158441 RepID=UPI001604AD63|nr:integrin beta-PS isoform X2 [Folsomia candida]